MKMINSAKNFLYTSADLGWEIGKSSISHALSAVAMIAFRSFVSTVMPPAAPIIDMSIGAYLLVNSGKHFFAIVTGQEDIPKEDAADILPGIRPAYLTLTFLTRSINEIALGSLLLTRSFHSETFQNEAKLDLKLPLFIFYSKFIDSSIKMLFFSVFFTKKINTKRIANEVVTLFLNVYLKNSILEDHLKFKTPPTLVYETVNISPLSEKLKFIYANALEKNLTQILNVTDENGHPLFNNTSEFFQSYCIQQLVNKSSSGIENNYLNSMNDLISHLNKASGCYSIKQLKKILCNLSHVNHFDSSRCYSPFEIEYILKHHSMDLLTQGEDQTVAILQAAEDHNGGFNVYSPGIEEIYKKNKHVYVAKISNVYEMCHRLYYAKKLFNQMLNMIKLDGHGGPISIDFGKTNPLNLYCSPEVLTIKLCIPENCLDNVLDKNGVVALYSCNTGQRLNRLNFSLGDSISSLVPGRPVYAPILETSAELFKYISNANISFTENAIDTRKILTPRINANPIFTPLTENGDNLKNITPQTETENDYSKKYGLLYSFSISFIFNNSSSFSFFNNSCSLNKINPFNIMYKTWKKITTPLENIEN